MTQEEIAYFFPYQTKSELYLTVNLFYVAEIFPRDLRKKDKFIKHLTGEARRVREGRRDRGGVADCLDVPSPTSCSIFPQGLCSLVRSAGSMFTDYTTTPETARCQHVSFISCYFIAILD